MSGGSSDSASTRMGLAVTEATNATFASVAPGFAEIHGYTPEELVGQPAEMVLADDARAQIPQFLATLVRDGHGVHEATHVRKDGSLFPARCHVVTVRDAAGTVLYYAALVEKIEAEEPRPRIRERTAGYVAAARAKYRLTEREVEVLVLVAAGKTDKDIAKQLGRSPYTVHNHVRHILLKMGASSRTDATVRALREGLV